jgi:membrane-bound metal-dependent hydrolase YbcI (DUF457 family)
MGPVTLAYAGMPVTTFHFGPGALLKAIAPRWISLTAFVISQVVIDLESGYHLLRQEWPIHRHLHSMVLAGIAGLLTGTLVFLAARIAKPKKFTVPRSEVGILPAYLGGLMGGVSHSVLDSIMHLDLVPFWPFSDKNPLLDALSVVALHILCIASGLVGVTVLAIRWSLLTASGKSPRVELVASQFALA